MANENKMYRSARNPDDNAIGTGESRHIRSVSKGGEDLINDIFGFPDAVIPASPNHPINTPVFYDIQLPMSFNTSDLTGTMPVTVRNVTQGYDLIRQDQGNPLGNKQFIVFLSPSVRRHILRVHVGSAPATSEAGDTLSYEGYAIESVMDDSDYNDIAEITGKLPHSTEKSVYGQEIKYRDSSGSESIKGAHIKICEIGDWNMDTTASIVLSLSDLGITAAQLDSILFFEVTIRNDSNISRFSLNSSNTIGQLGGLIIIDLLGNTIELQRTTGGLFDNVNYDSTSFNRGWLKIEYIN